ncbi:MAG TPA: hypothetical protein VMO26_17535 [Vicinamibacterales bacterium]|nr:hypothetical protein [Vicinamibacterales bacterium]
MITIKPRGAFVVALPLVLVFSSHSAYAQSNDSTFVPLPRGFVGVGLAKASSDAESRMRLVGEDSSLVWLLEAGVAVTPRFGVSVEFAKPTAVAASTRGRSFQAFGRQEERALIGLARVRAWGFDHWAVDLVGGAGVLFQHHELRSAPCFSGCAETRRETLAHRAAAFSLGAEIPVRVTGHFSLSAVARYCALRRGEHVTELPNLIPWQYEWKSSARIGVGIVGRAVW